MSDASRSSEGPEPPLQDIMRFCNRILDYTAGIDRLTFVSTPIVYDAILWNIGLIGEAASNASAEIRHQHAEIAWRSIVATRNLIIHRYWRIDSEHVWNIV